MYLDERSDQCWQLTNTGGMATSSGFPSRVETITPPNNLPPGNGVQAHGDGVISMGSTGSMTSKRIKIRPFGVGDSGTQFQMSVIAWTPTTGVFFTGDNVRNNPLWLPDVLATYLVTLSSRIGVVGSDLGSAYSFPSAISQLSGPTFQNANFVSEEFMTFPTFILVPTMGPRFLEVTFSITTAQSANALYLKI